jgi:RNA polymerase sigma factor (TIGR02999 family)
MPPANCHWVAVDHSPNGAVTRLLAVARDGDGDAMARVCELLYADLRQMAHRRLRSQQPLTLLDTTVLVHESFLRLEGLGEVALADRSQFLAYAARVMRSVIVDTIRRRSAARRGGDHVLVTFDTELCESVAADEDDVLRLAEAVEDLSRVDPRAAQVVEMRYFAGMADAEIAVALGVTERTVGRDWRKAKMLLHAALN